MTTSNHIIGESIAASAGLAVSYADRLLTGVTADKFARFAPVGNSVVTSNHPCFILGHLSLYAPRVVAELDGDAKAIQPSETFVTAFSKDAVCVDDPDGTIYPAMDEVVSAFRSSHQVAIDLLPTVEDSVFHQPNPNDAMREKFPTIAAMHSFYLGGHIMIHMGQFSAWRRMMGMPAA